MLRHPSLLRFALAADAIASGAIALLLLIGADLLAPFLGLPASFLRWTTALLFPFVALLAWAALRQPTPLGATRLIVLVNLAWVVASFAFAALQPFAVTALGTAFVLAQALALLLLATLQWAGLRQSGAAPRPA